MIKKASPSLLQVRIIYILTTLFLVALPVYGYLQTKFTLPVFINPILIIILFLSALLILWISYSKINSELHLSQQLLIKVEESNRELQKNIQELTEGAERFFKIFDNSPVAMTFAEIETNHIVYANNLFYNYFGYSEEEVIGYTSEELNLTSEEENNRLIPIILSHLEEDRSIGELKALSAEERAKLLLTLKEKMHKNGFEILYTRKNGETFFAIVFVEVIEIANKKYSLTTYQDITERKEAQKQLSDEKAFAEMVIENDPSMIVVYDENLHIITWNKKSEEFSGLKKEDVLGKSTFDAFPEYNQEQWLSTFNSVLKDGKSIHFPIVEIEHKKSFIESWLLPLRNTNQQIIGVLGITRNITEIIVANKELEKKNAELVEGGEHYLKIFDNSPIAMTFADIETNHVVYANNLFYSSFGYSVEEVIGHTTEELNLTSEEENNRLFPIILSHLEEDRSIEELKALSAEERAKLLLTLKEKMLKNGFEILYTRKNGETFFAIVFVEVIDIANKKYSLTTYQDITERKEAQRQLADEKAFAEMVIENDPSMIVVYDENLHIITWNKKSEEFSGLKKEEVLGKSTFDAFPEYNQEQWLSNFNSVLKEGKSIHLPIVEIEHKKSFIESWLLPLRNTSQQIIGVLGITRDITEIIVANKELEKKNAELIEGGERYLKIFDNNPVAMAFAEIGSNKIVYANSLFYDQFGYSAEEVIGNTSEDLNLVSPEEKERLQAAIMVGLQEHRTLEELQALSEKETLKLLLDMREKMFENGFEVIYTRKNGTTFYAIVFYEIIEIGNKSYTLASYQDISEIKKVSQQLEEKNKALTKINKELEAVNYISSHDLQEPLRKIQVFSSRISELEKQNLSADGKIYFEKMTNSAQRMQNLIADLLTYSRSKTEERKFANSNLNQIVTQVKEEFEEIIEEKHAKIEIDELGDANVIPFQFRQMMYNLIGNSLKFVKPETPPVISIKNKKIKSNEVPGADHKIETEYHHISITDNGIGFEPKYKDRIFEVFQRLHDKQKIAGTGIGLAIVKNIVENHNGIITATSELYKGATFDIYIPTIQNYKSQTT